VAIHVFGHMVGRAPRDSRAWWIAMAIDVGWIWVVPGFVMISGALMLGSKQLTDSLGFSIGVERSASYPR
jgi:surface polysaccharide O-acyltransferase-like enzyme